MFCKLQKVNLLMVGEHIELLVLNCYIYKFSMILKLPISYRDNRYPIFYRINYLGSKKKKKKNSSSDL
ncbi:hypothetical protein HanIR_Chr06g0293861 [Helianthus annuus]|nr:hypothetical protein HanIR_Chr06g0293861 [Helianthus annuus]